MKNIPSCDNGQYSAKAFKISYGLKGKPAEIGKVVFTCGRITVRKMNTATSMSRSISTLQQLEL